MSESLLAGRDHAIVELLYSSGLQVGRVVSLTTIILKRRAIASVGKLG